LLLFVVFHTHLAERTAADQSTVFPSFPETCVCLFFSPVFFLSPPATATAFSPQTLFHRLVCFVVSHFLFPPISCCLLLLLFAGLLFAEDGHYIQRSTPPPPTPSIPFFGSIERRSWGTHLFLLFHSRTPHSVNLTLSRQRHSFQPSSFLKWSFFFFFFIGVARNFLFDEYLALCASPSRVFADFEFLSPSQLFFFPHPDRAFKTRLHPLRTHALPTPAPHPPPPTFLFPSYSFAVSSLSSNSTFIVGLCYLAFSTPPTTASPHFLFFKPLSLSLCVLNSPSSWRFCFF